MKASRWKLISCVATLAFPAYAASQTYPTRPITVIVTAAPGGNADIEARRYTVKLRDILGQPIVIDFKLGGGGTIGAGYVAKASPDGYTVLASTGSFTTFPAFYPDLPFDTIKDFSPVSLMSLRPTILMVHPSFPAKTFAEYVTYARANPEKINFATSGSGGVVHLAGAWMHNAMNLKVTYVHYKGQAPATVDLIAERVDVATSPAAVVLKLVKAAKVRALAVMGGQRSKILPDIRSVAEDGIPDYNYAAWHGYIAPARTPPIIVGRLSEALAKVAKDTELLALLAADDVSLVGSSPERFRQFLVADTARWKKVVSENGIAPGEE